MSQSMSSIARSLLCCLAVFRRCMLQHSSRICDWLCGLLWLGGIFLALFMWRVRPQFIYFFKILLRVVLEGFVIHHPSSIFWFLFSFFFIYIMILVAFWSFDFIYFILFLFDLLAILVFSCSPSYLFSIILRSSFHRGWFLWMDSMPILYWFF